jgi:hypothetical protein
MNTFLSSSVSVVGSRPVEEAKCGWGFVCIHPSPKVSRINDHSSFVFAAAASCFCFARRNPDRRRKLKKKYYSPRPAPLPIYLLLGADFCGRAQNNLFVWIDFRVARVVAINICQ